MAAATMAACVSGAEVKPAYTEEAGDTVCQVFIYSPGERDGLHLAYLGEDGQWQHVGQLCGSDYGPWGAEKRMHRPSIAHAADGTWRLVFSVNDVAPCLAVAYSEDLVTWRPQDYPRMSVKGCLDPVAFAMDDGTTDIYFRDVAGGKHYVQASADFRRFHEDSSPSTIDDVAWLRDTVTVGDRQMEGYLFDLPKLHVDYVRQWFRALSDDAQRSSETMRDDATRFDSFPATVNAELKVQPDQQKAISDRLIGVFFEDISYAADGGLYAELVQNRDFEYKTGQGRDKEWGPQYAWHFSKGVRLATDEPLSKNNPMHIVLDADTIWNDGWDDIIDQGACYDFSFYARLIGCQKKQFSVALVTADGTVLAEGKVKAVGEGWQRYQLTLDTRGKKLRGGEVEKLRSGEVEKLRSQAKCQLRMIAKKGGDAALDMISLFPRDTYHGHGLRKDLAETIAALKPKFVRFPGGCMSHGQGIDNIYHWNETVGPWQDRKSDYNIWHYHQTRGLGFYEFFQFCEDIGAEPLPVLAAGVPCQNSAANSEGLGGQQGGIPMEEMPAYIDELCNLIEWANGDAATSQWARLRAEAGHPEPFHLKYIGIGNEDIISTTFEDRCEMICRAIRQRYPDITICGTVGPFHDPSADYIEGWHFAKAHKDIIDMVDEHYYESPGWFMNHLDYYDDYDRTGPKVYVGEYASRTRTHESALAEALYLCNIERNGDIVAMTSYAPLLAKEGHHNWNPDMIYFDNTSVQLTPSYHTQWLFGNHSGDSYVNSQLTIDHSRLADESREVSMENRVAASVVRDSKTGRTYLKLVNALPCELSVSVAGMTIPGEACIRAFTGQPTDRTVRTFNIVSPASSSADENDSGEPCVRIIQSSESASGHPVVTIAPYTVCAIIVDS